jgi:hypothetical protein
VPKPWRAREPGDGLNDVLVPIDDSRELLRNSGLSDTALREVGEEHDMTDPEALRALLEAVESFRG